MGTGIHQISPCHQENRLSFRLYIIDIEKGFINFTGFWKLQSIIVNVQKYSLLLRWTLSGVKKVFPQKSNLNSIATLKTDNVNTSVKEEIEIQLILYVFQFVYKF